MSWSFKWKGFNITHENDECYIFHYVCETYEESQLPF